jgi:hypothetical protein
VRPGIRIGPPELSGEAYPMPEADEILRLLESFRKRKSMYIGEVEVKAAGLFLAGFLAGCLACGFPVSWDKWRDAAAARRWKRSPLGPVPEMQARGMSEEEIADELIAIHAEMVRRVGEGA